MANVDRQHVYIGDGNDALSGWLHRQGEVDAAGRLVVIASPLGTEYMSGYRSVRHLADALAVAGNTALRFDYCVLGDSGGGDFSTASVSGFCDDISRAVGFVREIDPSAPTVLIGIGLGASFAGMVASSLDLSGLVLWNPTLSGRRFVREQKLLSELLNKDFGKEETAIDAGGVHLDDRLRSEFSAIRLEQAALTEWPRTLVVDRADLPLDSKSLEKLVGGSPDTEVISTDDYTGMMQVPTETVVPLESISEIVRWTSRPEDASTKQVQRLSPAPILSSGLFREIPAQFGDDQALFGIVCEPVDYDSHSPDWIFLNCGSEHHAGPHRIYTRIARKLAEHGIRSLRFDIEGIGDSISRGRNPDNNPYSSVAVEDLRSALQFMKSEKGSDAFTLIGICAGSYHSFRCAAQIDDSHIPRAILVNPLVYEWDYDNPGNHFSYEMHTYSDAATDRSRWMRLLRGQVDYRRLIHALTHMTAERLKRSFSEVFTAIGLASPSGVARDLGLIEEHDRHLTLILSENDPGLNLLRLQAPAQSRRFLRDQRLAVYDISGANHGFSKKSMQDKLVDLVESIRDAP